MPQLPLAFADHIVLSLISREISITTYECLPATVAAATVEQLEDALRLLPEDMKNGRFYVLDYALNKKRRNAPSSQTGD